MTAPLSSVDAKDGEPDATDARHDASHGWRILLVDDSPDDRLHLRQMLLHGSHRRCVFVEADRGSVAVQTVLSAQDTHQQFDFIILDFHLPDMDALEVLTALRGSSLLPPCPIIVITGWDGVSREHGARLLHAGAQDYIGKSWTSAESLHRSVENSIERFDLLKRRSTAEAALRDSDERYRSLFNSLNECLCVVEKLDVATDQLVDFRYVSFNPAFLAQSDIRGEIGHTMRQVLPDESEEWFSTLDQVCITGVPRQFERTVLTGDRALELYAFRLGGTESRRVAIIFWDITARKQSELKLRAQAVALTDADRRKDEFLAMLGHELRNPLAPLHNAVLILQLPQTDEPRRVEALHMMERQVAQLTRLVEDLLDVSRVTTGQFQLRLDQCTIGEIVARAVSTTRSLVEQRAHVLTVTVPLTDLYLHADAARLEQVVVNLLNNAVKYSNAGGGIWLTVEQDDDTAVVRVRDIGIGISAELLPRIFDLFSQAERSLDRSEGGLGVGLCLVRRLVELHGGTVVAFSTIGEGSEFVVRLPLMADRSASPPAPLIPARDIVRVERSLRILVVDDNVDAAESLAMLLEMDGLEVWVAHDGEAALIVALAHPPDVVFLDIGLPLIDGYEVARRLRRQDGLVDVVIVAVTGYGHARDRDLTRRAGFDHHLLKPVDLTLVQNILAAVVR